MTREVWTSAPDIDIRKNDIYDQHRAAFANVSAYVIMRDNERVATIAFKHPRDGASRLYVYIHWIGAPMVRGHAGGYGYDKMTAACANAAAKLNMTIAPNADDPVAVFGNAIAKDGGHHWDHMLRSAGFGVMQAV
jgi:hypothetical protein